MLRHTVEALARTAPDAELVVVDDDSSDGSAAFLSLPRWREVTRVRSGRRLGVAAARNLGARRATAQLLVFSDAHVEPGPGWVEMLLDAVADPATAAAGPAITDLVRQRSTYGYGFTWADSSMTAHWLIERPDGPSAVPFLPGCFVATSRRLFDELGGFDGGLRTWGHEDAEYSLRVWLNGYRCVVVPGARVAHRFRSTFAYEVDPATVLHNRLRIGVLHLSPGGLRRLLRDARFDPNFPAAFQMLMTSDVWRRRDAIRARRSRSDEWFFERFGIRAFASP